MKRTIKASLVVVIMLVILAISGKTLASEKTTILKETGKYLIYNKDAMDEEFTFALSKENNKENLIFFPSAADTKEENSKNIAYVDDTTMKYLDENLEAYLYIRDKEGNYIVDAEKVNLKNAIDKDLVETTTKRIEVDTTKTNKTTNIIDGVKTEVTKGKVVITASSKAEYSYMLVKLPTESENDYSKLMKLAEQLENKEEINNLSFIEKLELMDNFYSLYSKLQPAENDSSWVKVENSEILEPEDSKNGEQYIVFIKSVNGNEVITDAQFLTCYDEYKPIYEKEINTIRETSKLPVTYDSIALIVIFTIVIVAIVVTLIIRKKLSTKKENK